MAKCLYCNKVVECDKEAHVVIPNPEQCGYQSRRSTKFVHAKCYEAETVRVHKTDSIAVLRAAQQRLINQGCPDDQELVYEISNAIAKIEKAEREVGRE